MLKGLTKSSIYSLVWTAACAYFSLEKSSTIERLWECARDLPHGFYTVWGRSRVGEMILARERKWFCRVVEILQVRQDLTGERSGNDIYVHKNADSSISCPLIHANNGSTLKEDEGLTGSKYALQQESEKPTISTEMTWLANDFAQECIWKATVAAQISQTAAFCSRVRLQLQKSLFKHKEISHTLAEAIMELWHTLQ
ncbi:hypothetical protein Tco_1097562, partial [Tanacetum coccineum]